MAKSRKLRVVLIVLGFFLTSFYCSSTPPLSFAEEAVSWNSYKGNHAHSGFYNQTTENKLSLQWKHYFRGDYVLPIQVVQDTFYYVDRSGFLCAANRSDGSEIYRVRIHPERSVVGVDVSNDFIVAVMGPVVGRRSNENLTSMLSLFDRKTGKKIWEKIYEVTMMTNPVLVNNTLFFGTGKLDVTMGKTIGGMMLCLDVPSGETRWQIDLEDYAFVLGYPLTYANNVLLAQAYAFNRTTQTMYPPKLYAVDANKGRILWSKQPMEDGRSFGYPSIRNNEVYLLENPGMMGGGGGPGRGPGGGPGRGPGGGTRRIEAWLLKLELTTGNTIASLSIENENFGTFSPTLAHDAIYLNSFTGKIYSIDYHLDRIYWQKEFDRFSFFTELTASRNYLYTVLYNGELMCISKDTGNIQFRYFIGNHGGIPVLVDDQLIVSGDTIYCFSSKAEPLLLVEPSRLYFDTFNENESKQLSFRVLYTGFETLEGYFETSAHWIKIKPAKIVQNHQVIFVQIDQKSMEAGPFEEFILIHTNYGSQRIVLEGEFKKLPPLELEVNIPEEGFSTNQKLFRIIGKTMPLIPLWINGLALYSQRDGSFAHAMLLKEGSNTIEIMAVSHDQRIARTHGLIILDTIPPVVDVLDITSIRPQMEYEIAGKTEAGAVIHWNEETYEVDASGFFVLRLVFEEARDEVQLIVRDKAGNVARIKLQLP